MGLFTYMGVTESDVAAVATPTSSFIAICYDGAPVGTTVTIDPRAQTGTAFPATYPNSSGNVSDNGIAFTTWVNSTDPTAATNWGTGSADFYVTSGTGPFSHGPDLAGPLHVAWGTGVGVVTYPQYPAPTITVSDWSDAHPQPYLQWLPVPSNDPHFTVVYEVSRAFDPGGPYTDALGLAGFGGYPYTYFTDSIGGTAGYVYYRVTAFDAVIGPGLSADVTIYRPPPVITPPPPPPTPSVATGPHMHGMIRRRPRPR